LKIGGRFRLHADALDAARLVDHRLEAAEQAFNDAEHAHERGATEHNAEQREERAKLVGEDLAAAARNAHEEKSHARRD
jgi:hypothetical protein